MSQKHNSVNSLNNLLSIHPIIQYQLIIIYILSNNGLPKEPITFVSKNRSEYNII